MALRSSLRARASFTANLRRHRHSLQASRGEQVLLRQQYVVMQHLGLPLPTFAEVEFRNYSQTGEDGILLLLASVLGVQAGRMVEVGCGDGIECNSANLTLNHAWSTLLIDGDPKLTARARAFYEGLPETNRIGPSIVDAWVGSAHIGQLLESHGFGQDIDVLSIDLDSIDVWVAKALAGLDAKVIVVEYNNRIPAGFSVSVPDTADFRASDYDPDLRHGQGYFGASLDAFVQVLPGHRLVGANSANTNAFFVRQDLALDALPEVTAASCLSAPWAQRQQARWWPTLQARPWVIV